MYWTWVNIWSSSFNDCTIKWSFYLSLSLHSHNKSSDSQCSGKKVLRKNGPALTVPVSQSSSKRFLITSPQPPAFIFHCRGLGFVVSIMALLSLCPGKYFISVTEVRKSDHILVLSAVERTNHSEWCCSVVLPLNNWPLTKQLYLYLPFIPKAFGETVWLCENSYKSGVINCWLL